MEKPEIVDWDKDHVDLTWKTPEDGGASIEEFIVEKVFLINSKFFLLFLNLERKWTLG